MGGHPAPRRLRPRRELSGAPPSGEEIIYVLQGTLEYQLEGQSPVRLEAGQVLFVPTGVFHSARNVGSTPGSELATYVVQKGRPLVEFAP